MNEALQKSQKVLTTLSRNSPLGRVGALLAVLVAVLVAGYVVLPGFRHDAATGTPREGQSNADAIPVTVTKVKNADFPVYLNGLGTVQPYDTVTVRSQVDGEVTTVSFKQGQMVKEGDVLVQIDPRSYQAALDGALAKKAQDEANLKNAELNLARYKTLALKCRAPWSGAPTTACHLRIRARSMNSIRSAAHGTARLIDDVVGRAPAFPATAS